ncbi:MAG: protoheme IX farnesyltransferase, partial [bacterium]
MNSEVLKKYRWGNPTSSAPCEEASAESVAGVYPFRLKVLLSSFRQKVSLYLQLAKIRITFLAGLSTTAGFILHSREWQWKVLIPSLGIFLLASASSAFNHLQDRELDAFMERTRRRPLPAGKLLPHQVLTFAITLFLLGCVTLITGKCLPALWLGLLAMGLYNAMYTPLKRKSPFAVIPGSLIGAIPPLAGWMCAGGNPLAPEIL